MKIIYKKSDRLIVGSVFPRKDEGSTNLALSVELENILNSELGGKAEDYSFLDVDDIHRTGQDAEINDNLQVIFKPSQRSVNRQSAVSKLKKLGLTDSEIQAIT